MYLSEKKVPLLDFLFLVGENVGEQKINSLKSNLISSLDSVEEKLHRLKVSVKKTNIPTDNKIGQFIIFRNIACQIFYIFIYPVVKLSDMQWGLLEHRK